MPGLDEVTNPFLNLARRAKHLLSAPIYSRAWKTLHRCGLPSAVFTLRRPRGVLKDHMKPSPHDIWLNKCSKPTSLRCSLLSSKLLLGETPSCTLVHLHLCGPVGPQEKVNRVVCQLESKRLELSLLALDGRTRRSEK